jgi:hypothetical protein
MGLDLSTVERGAAQDAIWQSATIVAVPSSKLVDFYREAKRASSRNLHIIARLWAGEDMWVVRRKESVSIVTRSDCTTSSEGNARLRSISGRQ